MDKAAIITVAVFSLFLLWFIPPYQSKKAVAAQKVNKGEVAALENELRRTIAQILGGLFLLFGLIFTYRQLSTAQETQITNRFTQAIQQLGATLPDGKRNIEIRLGGIYALKRIVADSDEYLQPIREIFSAYVRQNAKYNLLDPDGDCVNEGMPPSTDIQAILTILAKLDYEEGDDALDLSRTNLGGIQLREGAILALANLGEANLSSVPSRETRLVNARLEKAVLNRTCLRQAILNGADLREADMRRAGLFGAKLKNAKLGKANLRRAELFKADLRWADLREADLREANLREADLEGADLEGADLSEATLIGANLKNIKNWKNANFSKAKIKDVKHPPDGFLATVNG